MNSSNILELDHNAARDFFLKHESYCNIDLPQYFSFTDLLKKVSCELSNNDIKNFCHSKIKDFNDVNYLIYANKDGKLSWRPFQIIHPLVYVSLVHKITNQDNWLKLKKRFKKFQKNQNILCLSIPVLSNNKQKDKAQQILTWWESVEQESIYLSLEYNYVFDTDIADCYSSIYTHSIAWAVESKYIAKKERQKDLLGNTIDKAIQSAQYGQTNGIPQGSVLMDFIAELVLGYIDLILSTSLKCKKIKDYKILRYRDDYRIFVKNSNDGANILRILSEIMMPFGLKLNSSKTKNSQDIISDSIKQDKLSWLKIAKEHNDLQKRALVIRQHSLEYPNSGSLIQALNEFDESLEKKEKNIVHPSLESFVAYLNSPKYKIKREFKSTRQIISIITDIAYSNPKAIPICCSILSKLFTRMNASEEIKTLVYKKLINMPNSGFAQIWLQRMLKSDSNKFPFTEKMCNLGINNVYLWNNDWIHSDRKKMLNALETPIFDDEKFYILGETISNHEVNIFY